MKRFFFYFHKADAGRLGVVVASAGRAGPVVALRLSKLDFVNAESFFFLAVGGRGVENLFEACFGFVSTKREVVVL